MEFEHGLLALASLIYGGAGGVIFVQARRGTPPGWAAAALVGGGWMIHTLSLWLRWGRLDHGPFLNLHELLSSNVWSLVLILGILFWRLPTVRPAAAVAAPIVLVMIAWMLHADPRDTHLPPTYDTPWLYLHVGFGKVFMGLTLAAVGVSGVVLVRWFAWGRRRFATLPRDEALDELAYRCLAGALLFDTLMLIAGAVWAQDAWGRWWNWDPLEVWTLMTWLLLALTLHLRPAFNISPPVHAMWILLIFTSAFLTFFGVPFFSTRPHQGVV
ncbi:MAG: cytochrome c biogenesis protein CcsA [Magnetococcales bacterium]|nr:cytochrome c biogenesis protein CcsA [Magnetococcales bacterium]